MLELATVRFLSQLKKNNNREWFEKHRADYEAAKIDFQNFIYLLIKELGKTDPSIADLNAKDCLFRINRDVRFSKNKSPYKSNMGASIKRGGKKSPFCGYYFHCEPGASFIGGGLWMPEPATVKEVRQEIDYNFAEFKTIISDKKFKSVYGDLYKGADISLATAPKGYEKDHPAISYLKLKCFIAETKLSDDELTKSSLHKKTITAFEALSPFVYFINRAIED